jgi:hypothetical protein
MLRMLVRSSGETHEVCSYLGLGELWHEVMAVLGDTLRVNNNDANASYCWSSLL